MRKNGVSWLVRTLDWPFAGLGRYAAVARMPGECGDFLSVTWPGYVGALTAMAPGRFAACVNQAPMRRRTAHRWLRPIDLAINARATWRPIISCRRINCCAERLNFAGILLPPGACWK